MNLSATILLAFGMSMDAFAASIGKGATLHKPKFSEAVRTGLIFGAIETLTPLVGWGLGMLASQFILEWNHWIAFILLSLIGINMIKEGKEEKENEVNIHSISFKDILLLAIATSIDALAVGVSFAFLKVNLWIATTTIGITTFVLSFICVLFGKTLGNLFEKYAEYMGGSILILLGIKILIEHLFF